MSTATIPPAAAAPVAPAAVPPDLAALTELMLKNPPGRVVTLDPADWTTYEHLLAVRTENRRWSIRLAYDGGRLMIMTVGNLHERYKSLLCLLLEAWTEASGGDYIPSGNLTIHRKDIARGFEPDACYYFQNRSRVAGFRELDFAVDPPPDLVIEIEVSRSAGFRLPIYAAYRVPEVWRYDGQRLLIQLLQPDGTYRDSPTSLVLPTLPLSEFTRYLNAEVTVDNGFGARRKDFLAWVQSLPPAPSA